MEIKLIPIEKLKPNEKNPRQISRFQLAALKKSIQEFGLVDPLVINKDMVIIGGHQRYKACVELGLAEVPCIVLDLSKSRETALNLALNKISGGWDRHKLEKILAEIEEADRELTGFDESEIAKMLAEATRVEPEYDIAPRLMEEYNYIVLFFKQTLDWQVALEHFGITLQQEDKRQKVGLGKVIDGAEYLKRCGR